MAEENRGAVAQGIIFWMILLGGYSTVNAILAMRQWGAYSPWTQLYYAVSLAAGACLASLALVRIGSRPRFRFAAVEVGVLAVLTINQAAGLLWSAIPCSTPG